MLARRCFIVWRQCRVLLIHTRASSSSLTPPGASSKNALPASDPLGLPISPSWSVHNLISSYPSPSLPNATLNHLHDLAALVPPKEDSPEFEQLKSEMEDLVRLVEAVRIAPDVLEVQRGEYPPDARVCAKGRGIALEASAVEEHEPAGRHIPSGRELLEHAPRTQNGFYLVDSARTKA